MNLNGIKMFENIDHGIKPYMLECMYRGIDPDNFEPIIRVLFIDKIKYLDIKMTRIQDMSAALNLNITNYLNELIQEHLNNDFYYKLIKSLETLSPRV